MRYIVATHSDTGIKKQVNQDSLCVKVANTKAGQAVLAVICDGMGGLRKGELASATVIRAFSGWFESRFPLLLESRDLFGEVKRQWQQIIEEENKKILEYGIKKDISLGTTLAAILIVEGHYLIVNIGDSRVYQIRENIRQLTKDQTLVQKELQEKKITKEQAQNDPRKNILLQCIGATEIIEPEYEEGAVIPEEVYFLCSDGFCHKLKEEEMQGVLSPIVLGSEKVIKENLIDLVELNKSRGETDNISILLIKTY